MSTDLNEAMQTLKTRLANVKALSFNPYDAVLVNGKPECALCLGFTAEGKPYATSLESARVFSAEERQGPGRSKLLQHNYFNGLQEKAMLYDANLIQGYAIEALQGAIELIQSMIKEAA